MGRTTSTSKTHNLRLNSGPPSQAMAQRQLRRSKWAGGPRLQLSTVAGAPPRGGGRAPISPSPPPGVLSAPQQPGEAASAPNPLRQDPCCQRHLVLAHFQGAYVTMVTASAEGAGAGSWTQGQTVGSAPGDGDTGIRVLGEICSNSTVACVCEGGGGVRSTQHGASAWPPRTTGRWTGSTPNLLNGSCRVRGSLHPSTGPGEGVAHPGWTGAGRCPLLQSPATGKNTHRTPRYRKREVSV